MAVSSYTELDRAFDNIPVFKKVDPNQKDKTPKKISLIQSLEQKIKVNIDLDNYPFKKFNKVQNTVGRKDLYWSYTKDSILKDKIHQRVVIGYKFKPVKSDLFSLNLIKVDRGEDYNWWMKGNADYQETVTNKKQIFPPMSFDQYTHNPIYSSKLSLD